VVPPTSFSRL
jgi:hypothetical protein